LKLHRGGDRVGTGRAAAPLFGLAERGVRGRGDGTHEADAARGVLIIGNRRVTDGRAVGLVVLRVIGFLFPGKALEVSPGLKLHRGRDGGRAAGAAAVELGLALCGVDVRAHGAHETRARRIFVVVERRVAHRRAVRLVILRIIRLLFIDLAEIVGPRLELHRGGDRVRIRRAAAPEFRLTKRRVGACRGRAYEPAGGACGILVIADLRVPHVGAVGLVVLLIVGPLFAGVALEIGPSLQFHRCGDDGGAGRAAAVLAGLALRGIDVGGGGANDRERDVLVVMDRRIAHVRSVGFVVLDVIGLFFAREALEIGPRLKFHRGGDDVRRRGASAPLLGFTERRIRVCRDRADQGGGVRGIFVVGDRGVADRDSVGAVVLDVISLLFVRHALEVAHGLKFHRRGDRVRTHRSAAVELGLALRRFRVGDGCAYHPGAARGVFVEMDLRVADRGSVRPIILKEVGFLFVHEAFEVGMGLELHRRGDDVRAGGAIAELLGLAQSRIRA